MTVSDELRHRIEAMPKVEIHVHLERATDAEPVYEMAAPNRLALPTRSLAGWKRFYKFTSFDHFIDVYTEATRCMRSPEDFALMVERFSETQARQHVHYSQ